MPVKLTYLKDKLSQRVPNMKGDLLVIRSNFTIKRSDFGLNPGKMEEKVSDAIDLTLSIAGASRSNWCELDQFGPVNRVRGSSVLTPGFFLHSASPLCAS